MSHQIPKRVDSIERRGRLREREVNSWFIMLVWLSGIGEGRRETINMMASVGFCSSTMICKGSSAAIAGNVRTSYVCPATAARQVVICAESKREPRSGGGRGITRPRPISPAMQKFLGVSEIPRTSAIKKIWEYIKEHDLQDPANRKEIICDERLKSIFGGRERVGFLEISGLMNPHFIKAE